MWEQIAGAAIGALGSLAGNVVGAKSAAEANETNIQLAKDKMDFEERMRATQYQTAVTDMQKAGLNPMLAYQHGGAGTPSGAQAVVKPEFEGRMGADAVNSAFAFINLKNQTDQVGATVRNIDADTVNKMAETQAILERTGLLAAQRTTESYKPQLLTKQANLSDSQSRQIDTLLYDSLAKIRADTALATSSARQIDSQNVLMKGLMDNKYTAPWAPYLLDIFRPGRK